MSVHDHPEFRNHENVVFCRDAEAGLRAIIAVHSTRLGPAAGGCRMYPYASEEDALRDALRLSFAMSYKNAVAGLPLGGGKTVVIGDPASDTKRPLLRAVARHIKRLNGLYWSAIDVGVSCADVDLMAEECPFVFARASQFAEGFDCATYTALGGHAAIRAAARHALGRDGLDGLQVAVQGIGQVGMDLCRRLHADGARLVVADTNAAAVSRAVEEFGARTVAPDLIYDQEADIFAPCALGGTLNASTIPRLKAKLVCGLANNQLATPEDGEALQARGITWAPDYVVNAGGMLGASGPIYGESDQAAPEARIRGIGDVLGKILERAGKTGRTPGAVANAMAEERITAGG